MPRKNVQQNLPQNEAKALLHKLSLVDFLRHQEFDLNTSENLQLSEYHLPRRPSIRAVLELFHTHVTGHSAGADGCRSNKKGENKNQCDTWTYILGIMDTINSHPHTVALPFELTSPDGADTDTLPLMMTVALPVDRLGGFHLTRYLERQQWLLALDRMPKAQARIFHKLTAKLETFLATSVRSVFVTPLMVAQAEERKFRERTLRKEGNKSRKQQQRNSTESFGCTDEAHSSQESSSASRTLSAYVDELKCDDVREATRNTATTEGTTPVRPRNSFVLLQKRGAKPLAKRSTVGRRISAIEMQDPTPRRSARLTNFDARRAAGLDESSDDDETESPSESDEDDIPLPRTNPREMQKRSHRRIESSQSTLTSESHQSDDDDDAHADDTHCLGCGRSTDGHLLMLCDADGCTRACHTFCLRPTFSAVPRDVDWNCPMCATNILANGDSLSNLFRATYFLRHRSQRCGKLDEKETKLCSK